MTDASGAESIEQQVLASLEALGARYERIRIDPAHANTAVFCERYGYPVETSANCILVASKTGDRTYAACLVPAALQVDVNRVVRKLMGVRKASFAAGGETEEVTGMLTDGVTPFGLPEGITVYVDARVLEIPQVIVGGGSRAVKIAVDPEVFLRMPSAEVVAGLARVPPSHD